jgi:hypothetical protein
MAAPVMSGSKKRSSDRKNPASAEFFAKRRKEQNAKRPKQSIETIILHGGPGEPDEVYHMRARD